MVKKREGSFNEVTKKPERFDIFLVNLDPVQGSEICKTRPCVVVSPDEMNHYIRTVMIAPMTTKSREYPSRVMIHFEGKDGEIALDQIRTVDKTRLVKHLGKMDEAVAQEVCATLMEMFTF